MEYIVEMGDFILLLRKIEKVRINIHNLNIGSLCIGHWN